MNITINIASILNSANTNLKIKDYHIKDYIFNNSNYQIIKYDKNYLKQLETNIMNYLYSDENNNKSEEVIKLIEKEYNELALLRSVIVRNNQVVCFSPPKSLSFDHFIKKYPKLENKINGSETTEMTEATEATKTSESNAADYNVWGEDFVDGTMINVFFDAINNVWEIATRSTVGGNIVFFNDVKNYKYFDDKNYFASHYDATFRSMFFEACNSNNFNLNTLCTSYCYTFVMQHPFNRIVTPIVNPLLYLVKIYKIDNSNTNCVKINEVNIDNFVNSPPYVFLNTNVKFVKRYNISDYNALKSYYINDKTPYYFVGTMLYSSDGYRSKIRNNNYETVRKLRGNQPKLQYNYFCLKQENKIKEFLNYYPEHNVMFNKFKILMYSYTNELLLNYISCFVRKEKPLKEYEFQYKTHMYKLHEKFKNDLKPLNKTIDKKFVIDYVNRLHPAQQMFIMNYKYNKNSSETNINSEHNNSSETNNMETNNMEMN